MEAKQDNLIAQLKIQPLIVVIRLEYDFFNVQKKRNDLFLKIQKLIQFGIINIEIGWDPNPGWVDLIVEIKNIFNSINIGIASISSKQSLDSIIPLDLNYSMSPVFKKEIHLKAIEYNQLVIPGISNIEDFNEAINLGYKIVKIYPASKLGPNFINELRNIKKKDIFLLVQVELKVKV